MVDCRYSREDAVAVLLGVEAEPNHEGSPLKTEFLFTVLVVDILTLVALMDTGVLGGF